MRTRTIDPKETTMSDLQIRLSRMMADELPNLNFSVGTCPTITIESDGDVVFSW